MNRPNSNEVFPNPKIPSLYYIKNVVQHPNIIVGRFGKGQKGDKGKVMIVLITGASHTGKTLLAQRMLEEYKVPYLSIDHLKMGLIRSGQTELTPEDDEALTDYLWPIVREMIKTAIENKQNLIVEGCYIPFDWRRDFDEQYLPSIQFVCLAMTDAYIDAHFTEIKAHSSDIEARLDDADCTIQGLKEENHAHIEGCQKNGEQVVMIDSDYQQTINQLLDEELVFV